MLYIQKLTANTIIPTFTELTTVSPLTYIIVFINDETKAYTYCQLGTNTSLYTSRYDKFVITDKVNPNGFNSEVNLALGDYEYIAYQTSDDTSAWVDLTNILNVGTIVEQGKARVFTTETTNTIYSGATSTNTVYEG